MASIQQDPSGNFHVSFRFGGKRFKRSLKTKIERKAFAVASHVEENIRLIESGRMEFQDDMDIGVFLLSDGKLGSRPKLQASIPVGGLAQKYLDNLPENSLEQTTQDITETHMRNFSRLLGKSTQLQVIKKADLQEYVALRSKEKGIYGKVSSTTIKKEMSTFRTLWKWAESHELIKLPFPGAGLIFPKEHEKPSFQTWDQIERRIKIGELTENQVVQSWDCLYVCISIVMKFISFWNSLKRTPQNLFSIRWQLSLHIQVPEGVNSAEFESQMSTSKNQRLR